MTDTSATITDPTNWTPSGPDDHGPGCDGPYNCTCPAANTHRIRHYVYEVSGDRSTLQPRTSSMRGSWPCEARCESCGVETRTGGATEGCIRRMVWEHKRGIDSGWSPVAVAAR